MNKNDLKYKKDKIKRTILLIISLLLLIVASFSLYFIVLNSSKIENNKKLEDNKEIEDNKELEDINEANDNKEQVDAENYFILKPYDKTFNIFDNFDKVNVIQSSSSDKLDVDSVAYSKISIKNNNIEIEFMFEDEIKHKKTITSIKNPISVTTYMSIQGSGIAYYGITDNSKNVYIFSVEPDNTNVEILSYTSEEELIGLFVANYTDTEKFCINGHSEKNIVVKGKSGKYYTITYDDTLEKFKLSDIKNYNALVISNEPYFILTSLTDFTDLLGNEKNIQYLNFEGKEVLVKSIFRTKKGILFTDSNNALYIIFFNSLSNKYEIGKYSNLTVKNLSNEESKYIINYSDGSQETLESVYSYNYINGKISKN